MPLKLILLSVVIVAIGGCHTDHDLTANELYVRGHEALENERPERAADYFARASDQNHTGATTELAELYLAGLGVEQNRERAKELWKVAASDGSAKAEHMLGYLSYAEDDYRTARERWENAASADYLPAYGMLATLYSRGHGVPQDYGKHVELLREAAALGSKKAQKALDRFIGDLRQAAEDGNEESVAILDSLQAAGLVDGE